MESSASSVVRRISGSTIRVSVSAPESSDSPRCSAVTKHMLPNSP